MLLLINVERLKKEQTIFIRKPLMLSSAFVRSKAVDFQCVTIKSDAEVPVDASCSVWFVGRKERQLENGVSICRLKW